MTSYIRTAFAANGWLDDGGVLRREVDGGTDGGGRCSGAARTTQDSPVRNIVQNFFVWN